MTPERASVWESRLFVHWSQPVDRCSESAVEIDEERGLKEIIDCGHY